MNPIVNSKMIHSIHYHSMKQKESNHGAMLCHLNEILLKNNPIVKNKSLRNLKMSRNHYPNLYPITQAESFSQILNRPLNHRKIANFSNLGMTHSCLIF